MVWLLAILVYLLDSLSFAVLLNCWFGIQDLRASGSSSPGATSMLRIAEKKLAVLALSGDVDKNLLPVLVARWLELGVMEEAWVSIAAVTDRLYLLCFDLCGDRDATTAAGMLFGLYSPAILLATATWLLTFELSCANSLVSLMAAPLTLPLLAWQQPGALLPMTVLTSLIVWRHHANLRNLFADRERHFQSIKRRNFMRSGPAAPSTPA